MTSPLCRNVDTFAIFVKNQNVTATVPRFKSKIMTHEGSLRMQGEMVVFQAGREPFSSHLATFWPPRGSASPTLHENVQTEPTAKSHPSRASPSCCHRGVQLATKHRRNTRDHE